MHVLYKHVRGGGGLKEMLILLMWLGRGGRQNAYIVYVKDQNSYSPDNHLTLWSKAIYEKISHIHP